MFLRSILPLTLLLLAGLTLRAQEERPFKAGHWKSSVVSEMPAKGVQATLVETWVLGKKLHSITQADGLVAKTWKDGEMLFVLPPGRPSGVKLDLSKIPTPPGGQNTSRFYDLNWERKAKKTASEKVNGYECDIYEMAWGAEGKTVRAWIARDLKFPVRIMTEGMTINNSDITVGENSVSEKDVTVPATLTFESPPTP